jgi:hypothetical protein
VSRQQWGSRGELLTADECGGLDTALIHFGGCAESRRLGQLRLPGDWVLRARRRRHRGRGSLCPRLPSRDQRRPTPPRSTYFGRRIDHWRKRYQHGITRQSRRTVDSRRPDLDVVLAVPSSTLSGRTTEPGGRMESLAAVLAGGDVVVVPAACAVSTALATAIVYRPAIFSRRSVRGPAIGCQPLLERG